MFVQHRSDKAQINSLLLDSVDVMGVSGAAHIYVNDVIHTNFTFNISSQVRM